MHAYEMPVDEVLICEVPIQYILLSLTLPIPREALIALSGCYLGKHSIRGLSI
jgi:hypothetical protein